MEFEWDENKRKINSLKHGVDFEDGIYIFEGFTLTWADERRQYGEVRYITLGMVDDRVLVIVYTDRNDVRRIISARKANRNEQRTYHTALSGRSPPDG